MKKKRLILGIVICLIVIVSVVFLVLFLFGREKSVEQLTKDYFESYVDLDSDIVNRIKYEFNDKLTTKQKDRYIKLMKKQYSDLEYKILDSREEGHLIFVNVEIKVYDFKTSMEQANSYISNYSDKFEVNGSYNNEKAINYKIDQLENTKDRIAYVITIMFQKNNSGYFMHDLTDADLMKINGTY